LRAKPAFFTNSIKKGVKTLAFPLKFGYPKFVTGSNNLETGERDHLP
jgi:hypothetical protein